MAETFIPLFSSTIRSSLWSLSGDCLKVFLTLALEAGPDGVIVASVDGIRRIVDMPIEQVRAHIATLESPDPHSKDLGRNPKCDGRRLERLHNGWRVVNLEWYREEARRQAELFRKRQWWSEKGTAARRGARRTETETYPEMEMERETETDLGSEGSPEGSAPATPAPAAAAAPKAKRYPKVSSWKRVPESWAGPNDSHRAQAIEWGWEEGRLELQAKAYRLHDYRRARKDPDRTFAAWMVTSEANNPGRKGTASAPQQSLSYQFPSDWIPTKEHRAKGLELGLTVDEILARADDCRLKPIKQGFTDPDQHFYRELAWAKRDKDADKARRESYANRKDFETPGRSRNGL